MIDVDPKFYQRIYMDNIERMTTLNVMKQLLPDFNSVKEPIRTYTLQNLYCFEFAVLSQLLTIEYNLTNHRTGFKLRNFHRSVPEKVDQILMKHFNFKYKECSQNTETFFNADLDKKLDFFTDIINMLYDQEMEFITN